MFSISCLTTLKLTSASNSAMRISRRALSMFSAESLPSPRRFLNTRWSLSDKLSNMRIDQPRKGIRARDLVESSYYSRYSAAAGAAGGGIVDISADNCTMDDFRLALEEGLNRPILDDTNMKGTYDIAVRGARSNEAFVQMLRDQAGIVLTPARRNIEMLVVRPLS